VSRSLLIVDDDETIREVLTDLFSASGWGVSAAATGAEAIRIAEGNAPDVAIVDLRLPDMGGVELLGALREVDPDVGVLILTGHADVQTAVRAMRDGAADVLEKPVDLETVTAAVERAARHGQLAREVKMHRARETAGHKNATIAPSIEHLIALAARNPDAPVLITGETGTGKGFVARAIHDRSPRRNAPFVEINAASLSPTFVESELFGHERGAFTDAKQAKRGLLEIADQGTLFLDEVGELPLDVQPRLLKVIEERSYRRLGGTQTLVSHTRLIAATNASLSDAVADRRFRADLFYRLQVLQIFLPPLREQPALLDGLISQLLPRGASLSAAARRAIGQYEWPGNIRELKNVLWRASLMAEDRAIQPDDLFLSPQSQTPEPDDLSLESAEKRAIIRALSAHNNNKTIAAKTLGIARSTLAEKLARYGIRD
jgi:DNA-binding NtrC family response regulator